MSTHFTLFLKWTSIRMRKPEDPDSVTSYGGSLHTADRHRCLDGNTGSCYSDIKLILFSVLTKDWVQETKGREWSQSIFLVFLFPFIRKGSCRANNLLWLISWGKPCTLLLCFKCVMLCFFMSFNAVHKSLWTSSVCEMCYINNFALHTSIYVNWKNVWLCARSQTYCCVIPLLSLG